MPGLQQLYPYERRLFESRLSVYVFLATTCIPLQPLKIMSLKFTFLTLINGSKGKSRQGQLDRLCQLPLKPKGLLGRHQAEQATVQHALLYFAGYVM